MGNETKDSVTSETIFFALPCCPWVSPAVKWRSYIRYSLGTLDNILYLQVMKALTHVVLTVLGLQVLILI